MTPHIDRCKAKNKRHWPYGMTRHVGLIISGVLNMRFVSPHKRGNTTQIENSLHRHCVNIYKLLE